VLSDTWERPNWILFQRHLRMSMKAGIDSARPALDIPAPWQRWSRGGTDARPSPFYRCKGLVLIGFTGKVGAVPSGTHSAVVRERISTPLP
jgi:hypothetical protein